MAKWHNGKMATSNKQQDQDQQEFMAFLQVSLVLAIAKRYTVEISAKRIGPKNKAGSSI